MTCSCAADSSTDDRKGGRERSRNKMGGRKGGIEWMTDGNYLKSKEGFSKKVEQHRQKE